MNSLRVLFLLCSAAVLNAFPLVADSIAQTQTATISGAVTDPRGAVVAAAHVVVTQIPPSGEAARATSGSDGQFQLTLPPGRYRLTVSRASFATTEQEIAVSAGETRDLQIHLSLERLSSSVVVTAQTQPLDAESSPAPVTILTRADIDERVATSVPDLLATQAGFSLGRTGPEGGLTSLFLDGGNSNYTKVLVDGAPVSQPGGFIDFSNLTLDNVEKIEVVHGAESALYGSDAMDGVIQIFTHRGTTRIPEFTAFTDGGSYSTVRGGAELSGLLGLFDYSGAIADLQTQGQGKNDAFRDRTLSGNFGWRFSDSDRVSLAVRDNGSDAGIPGATLLQPPNVRDSAALDDFSASVLANFATGAHWQHQVLGTELFSREFNIDPFFPTLYQFNVAAVTAQTSYVLRKFASTLGYEYQVENGFVPTAASGGNATAETHARRNNQAGFLDLRWQPLARLTLNAGARLEDNDYFGIRGLPRAGASYALRIAKGAFGDTRIRANYGLGIVAPRFDQSYGRDPCFPGNPNLSPEQSRTVHAGIEQKLASDRIFLTADYFDSRFHNIISFDAIPPSPECVAIGAPNGAGTFFNTNLARARGATISGQAQVTRWLSVRGNYTYDSTRTLSAPTAAADFDPNYIVGSRLLRRPVNSGNLMLNVAFWRMNWNLSGYFTGQREDANFIAFTPAVNPGYARLDLGANHDVARGFSLYGRIANMTNKQYQDAYGYPALGREFRIGVKYTTRRE